MVSAACVSSTAAIGYAADLVKRRETDCVLVVACDSVNEFVFSGFSSLMAMGTGMAMPFDRNRDGLTLGEAAGYALVLSEERARRESRPILGEVVGMGLSNDAYHMTGPLPDGSGLSMAIKEALADVEIVSEQVDSISAHGTSTIRNDAMEIEALKAVWSSGPRPTYSIKGAIGHTLGVAGLIEAVVAFESMKHGQVPPTVGLSEPEDEARCWVRKEPVPIQTGFAVSTAAGFGGINGALVLGPARQFGETN